MAEGPRPGEVWLDSSVRPTLVLGEPETDPYLGIEMSEMAWLRSGPASNRWSTTVARSEENGLDEDMHVDCRTLVAGEPKILEVVLGRVDPEILTQIAALTEEMMAVARANEMANRFSARAVAKHQYDVALSFAGQDRRWAAELAERLRGGGVRVFYDDYERAEIWGKDLVVHLDDVYRNRARFCVVFVSAGYAASIWSNHELKSALARSLVENEEYLLPLRLDETELPGLRPTVAYLSLTSSEDVAAVADVLVAKLAHRNLISYAEFSSKWMQNVIEINNGWRLDCLAFCVDRRFVLDEEGFECRLGISYGVNTTSPRIGWLQPEEQEGANVFGIHCIAVVGGTTLRFWDMWFTSLPAPTTDRLEDAVRSAYEALAAIDDERYELWASSGSSLPGLHVSDTYLLDEFDISTENG